MLHMQSSVVTVANALKTIVSMSAMSAIETSRIFISAITYPLNRIEVR